jgi:murein DD-endopeptidase MepM/ murein hydrolase activator NlpD
LAARWRAFLGDQVSPVRLASHAALLLVAVLVILLSRIDLPQWEVVRVAPVETAERPATAPLAVFNQQPVGGSPLLESGVLLRAPVPFTEIADRPRTGVITYTVQVEDTVLGIAEKFGLNPNTIVWANHELTDNPFLMEIGQELIILPVDGVYHKVKEGDTIKKLATRYRVTAEKIIAYPLNNLQTEEDALTPGQMLIVPDGDATPPAPPAVKPPSAPWRNRNFVWPSGGRITQGFWLPAHPALDLGTYNGAPVWAADEGVVAVAGWSTYGYGNYVVIRHYDGFETLYAHLSRIDVAAGNAVSRGQQIGAVGSTGRSTGPHLHFEVNKSGRSYNPLLYLP